MNSPLSQFVFVDFENVQDVDLELVRDRPVHVTLLIGAKQTKLPTKLATQMNAFAPQVRPVEVGGSGRNALDLTLAAYLGREIERHPAARFAIVSRDTDFDPMIAHLQTAKVQIARVANFAAVPFFAKPKKAIAPKPPVAPTQSLKVPAAPSAAQSLKSEINRRRQNLIDFLGNPTNKNRPATEKTLRTHIKSSLGTEVAEQVVEDTITLFKNQGLLSLDAKNKVVYRAT